MHLLHMRYFIEIAKTKNISQAALNLHLSQPSLSFAVKALEQELGIPLLIRHSKSVSLTDAGETFLAYAEKIIGSTDQLTDLMHRHSRLLAGKLRLGVLVIGGYVNLFALLNKFREQSEGITYELTFDVSDLLVQRLIKRQIHGAFIISVPHVLEENPELHHIKISTEEYMLIVPKSSPLSRKECISVSDLKDEVLVMPSPNTIFFRQLSVMLQEEGSTPKVLCSTSQSDIVGQITTENLAIGFASTTVAKKICPENCRILPFKQTERVQRMIYFITLKELLNYPLTKAFTDFVDCYVNGKH